MQKIILHLVETNDSIENLLLKHNITKQQLFIFNPTCRNNNIHPGQLIYLPIEEQEVIKINKDEKYYSLIKEIKHISYLEASSYINNYNDHMLIEIELFKKLELFSLKISSNNNDSKIIYNHLLQINKSIHFFIDSLKDKNESKIKESKKIIIEDIDSLNTFLESKFIDIENVSIKKTIENHMLIIAKILSNNYYDGWFLAHS